MNTGIYSPADAARILRLRPERLRAWIKGRKPWKGKPTGAYGPIFLVSDATLTFADLVELRIAKKLGEHGATFANIRTAHAQLQVLFDDPYPFLRADLSIDRKDVVATIENDLLNCTAGQFLMEFVRPTLDHVTFDGNQPVSLHPMGDKQPVVIDARVQFGQPIIEGTRVPTDAIYDLYIAEGRNLAVVAVAFGLTKKQVLAAIAFEEDLRKPWAA